MGEVLSQAEINQLIADLSQGVNVGSFEKDEQESIQSEMPVHVSTPRSSNVSSQKVKNYDFRIPEKFSRYHIHTAQAINDMFARLVSTALSVYLKAKVDVEVASVDQMTYEEYSKSIVVSSVNTVFSMEPLPGRAIIQFNIAVIFSAIDRLLGGPGWSVTRERELTDLERILMEGLVMKVLSVYKEAWSNIIEISPKIEVIECNPVFLPRIASPKDTVMLGTFEIKMGDSSGIMSICLPYGVVEPILSRLSSSDIFFSSTKDKDQMDSVSMVNRKKMLDGIPIPVIVELGNAEINLKELVSLQPGNVICLNKGVEDELEVRLMGVMKFLGRPGVIGENLGIQVTTVFDEKIDEVDLSAIEYYVT
jgi:flagellar motor switch protein FliM